MPTITYQYSRRGIPVDFFGEETTFPPGPLALAERTGAALLPVGTYFENLPFSDQQINHRPDR